MFPSFFNVITFMPFLVYHTKAYFSITFKINASSFFQNNIIIVEPVHAITQSRPQLQAATWIPG
jgi:hypothetical protein